VSYLVSDFVKGISSTPVRHSGRPEKEF